MPQAGPTLVLVVLCASALSAAAAAPLASGAKPEHCLATGGMQHTGGQLPGLHPPTLLLLRCVSMEVMPLIAESVLDMPLDAVFCFVFKHKVVLFCLLSAMLLLFVVFMTFYVCAFLKLCHFCSIFYFVLLFNPLMGCLGEGNLSRKR